MPAYAEIYLSGAQRRLGALFDFAVLGMGLDLARAHAAFLASPLSRRFAAGDPAVVAGRSGEELALEKAMQPGYKPNFYRNLFLCSAMVQLDMIDTIAMGIPKIFQMQRKKKVSNLLASMKNIDGTIVNTRTGKGAVWSLVD